MSLPDSIATATEIVRAAAADDRVTLDHAGRFLRRRRLISESGRHFLVDLPQARSLEAGEGFRLDDGTVIAVEPAVEELFEIRGDLVRAAWHIGNRHAPCQIAGERLLIGRDPVLADMLRRLGLEVGPVAAPFRPEGGAYGHGRTHGHDHAHG